MKKFKLIFLILLPIYCSAQYQFTNYTTYNTGSNSLGANTIFSIFENPITNNILLSCNDVLMEYGNNEFSSLISVHDPILKFNTSEYSFFCYDYSGNLWFEHFDTLNKYDGLSIAKFPLPSMYHVEQIISDNQGNIWIGTSTGLLKFDGTSFASITAGTIGILIHTLYKDPQGNIWVGTSYGVAMFNGVSWTSYAANEGLIWSNNSSVVYSIMQDESGNMWVGGREIAWLNGNSWTVLVPAQLTSTLDDIMNIETIVNDTVNHRLWFGSMDQGIFYRENGNWFRHTESQGMPSNRVKCGLADSQGRVWFGLEMGGLCKYESSSWTYYTTNSGLCENFINEICESADGEIWVATEYGTNKFDLVQWKSFFNKFENDTQTLVRNDFSGNVCVLDNNQMYRYNNGTWVDTIYIYSIGGGMGADLISESTDDYWSTGGGTMHFYGPDFWNPSNWVAYTQGLLEISCISMERGSSGILWVGTRNGMAYLQGNTFIPITIPNDDFGKWIQDLRTGLDGRLWIASNYGVACKTGSNWEFYFEADGLSDNWVWNIEIATDSTIWFATLNGVSVLTDTVFQNINTQDGLIHRHARCIEEDHLGNMWIGTQHGISKLHNAVPILEKEEIKQQTRLTIYPNPAKDNITISSSSDIIEIELYTSTGQLLLKINSLKKQETLDISSLAPGNYFIRAIGREDVWVEKFVVVR